jgi:hypothetical protein
VGALPVANATLTQITGPGYSEDYDEAATSGTVKWSGSVGAYIVEQVKTAVAATGLARVKTTYVVVPADVASDVDAGDSLTFQRDGATHTRVVWDTEIHEVAGTARLHLQDAQVTA